MLKFKYYRHSWTWHPGRRQRHWQSGVYHVRLVPEHYDIGLGHFSPDWTGSGIGILFHSSTRLTLCQIV
jgi:hypothetical protein